MERKERLGETYRYLRSKGYVHTQLEFANKIGWNKSNVSSAFSGKESYLTDGLLSAIHREFPELSEEWLLTGDGEMLRRPVDMRGRNNIMADNGSVAVGEMHGGHVGGYVLPQDNTDKHVGYEQLASENQRLRAQIEKLTNDNMKLIERVNMLTDKLLEKM